MTVDHRAQPDALRKTAHDSGASSITGVLRHLREAVIQRPEGDKIALRHILIALEQNSFIVIVLVFSLLMVSPLSAVPGATTLFGLTIASILAQVLLGRRHVWLPGVLLNRLLPVARILQALQWLEKPATWLEHRLHARLAWAHERPVAMMLKALVFTAALCAPLMEVIPASGTSVGAAITLFAAGLLARDGVFILLGACLAAILPVTLWMVIR
ncbi:exopolysaccharide biosynthesis protein [Roseinatronobacter sp. NSM]|uniref:exopolysaccharide biosynthesis protein n=1 Tax=Roseinatronobacter sp. NSM TaxID=3457785 RepID=UPI00403715C4